MSVAKEYQCPYKNTAFVAASNPSRPSSESGNKEFLTLLRAPNKPAGLSNPRPSLAPSQVLKYTKDNSWWILKAIMKAQILAYGQD